MSATIGIGVVGFWHVHAVDYAGLAARNPATELVSGWDADAGLAETGTAELGIENAGSLDELLADPRIDAVTVTTETSEHTAVITRALLADKHVFAEKLLAPTAAEAEQLTQLATERGRALVTSLPRLSEPATVTARALIAAGALGEITFARVRLAHDGWLKNWLPERFADPAAALGGALTDLGCHPVYLVQQFLGSDPTTVSATYGAFTERPVEDNAVVTLRYRNGAIGVAEAGFVSGVGSFSFEIHGSTGSLLYGFGNAHLVGKGGALGEDWAEIGLAPAAPQPFELWVDAIGRAPSTASDPNTTGDRTLAENATAAIELTRLVNAAGESAATGASVDYQKAQS